VNVAAVLSFTRDRLDYTRHCFETLRANAGCAFDHFVLDQGSTDGTREWLARYPAALVVFEDENVGITRAANHLLDVCPLDRYDVIVRFDNDCEVTQPDTLRTVCEVALEYDAIVAPRVNGLLHPPPVVALAQAGGHVIEETEILGGIFMAVPARLFSEEGFRYDETMPPWTGDEAIVPWWRARGGCAGYLRGWSVNHYETTAGQRERHPEYWARKDREMGLVAA
jgi:hypothetical protein